MEIKWDPRKAVANLLKHGVDFADAATVLHDEFAITISEENPDEDRHVTIGMDALRRLLVVIYAWRGESVRLISARRCTRQERRFYEEG